MRLLKFCVSPRCMKDGQGDTVRFQDLKTLLDRAGYGSSRSIA
jgi:hypothetical protein